MKDFLLTDAGDIRINNNDLMFVSGKELTLQKVRCILSTKKEEWILNEDEGINTSVILVKNPNEDEILSTVLDGLKQINEDFIITEYEFKTIDRHLILTFSATAGTETISLAVGEITSNEINYIIAATTAEKVIKSANAIQAICVSDADTEKIIGAL